MVMMSWVQNEVRVYNFLQNWGMIVVVGYVSEILDCTGTKNKVNL